MATNVNKLKNADFLRGTNSPTNWTWAGSAGASSWNRDRPTAKAPRSMHVDCSRPGGRAMWSQVVTCKPEEYYRIEAAVVVDATVVDQRGGVVVMIEALDEGEVVDTRTTPGIHHTLAPETIRAFYLVPENVRRLRISVGLLEAFGTAELLTARFIEMIEPDEMSHPLAVPPPPHCELPPLVAKRVCVCSTTAADRRVTRLLQQVFGNRNVSVVAPAGFNAPGIKTDAILFPDAELPPSVRTIKSLLQLAETRIVFVSLPAFTKISGNAVAMRRIDQPDDPINAKTMYGCWATRGFAMHDVFSYAWRGTTESSFAQNQFRSGKKFKEFCDKHKLEVFLNSMCDKDATSEQPIALFRQTKGGALFVVDIDPVEAPPTTINEPTLPMHLLLAMLGRSQTNLGQFASPAYKEAHFRETIREMAVRIEAIHVHDADVPADQITEQLVTVGSEDESFGLPIEPKPVILVRSGLRSGDAESIYGVWTWFKQLVRPQPFVCPYAGELGSVFRFAWIPSVAPWDQRAGLLRQDRPPTAETSFDTSDGELAALIDVVSVPHNRVRICFPKRSETYEHFATWAPQLFAAFRPGRYFAPTIDAKGDFGDRTSYAWRVVETPMDVVVDSAAFGAPEYAELRDSDVSVLRIEVPGWDADFTSCSIQRTDVVATALEQVIGLQYGLIAVNRSDAPVQFDGFAPVLPGAAIALHNTDPALQQLQAV